MIAPEHANGKCQADAGSRAHYRFVMRTHEFVNEIILLPKFEQARAKLKCDLKDCCLRARSAFEHRIPQPPSPPGFGADRAQSFCVALRNAVAYGSIPNES
jgi:hypothetical protein